jgi:hypothetical protein
VLTACSFLNELGFEEALRIYQTQRDKYNDQYTEIQQTKEPSAKQAANWVPLSEIKELITEYDTLRVQCAFPIKAATANTPCPVFSPWVRPSPNPRFPMSLLSKPAAVGVGPKSVIGVTVFLSAFSLPTPQQERSPRFPPSH